MCSLVGCALWIQGEGSGVTVPYKIRGLLKGLLEFELVWPSFSSLLRVMLTSPSILLLTEVVLSYKVHVL